MLVVAGTSLLALSAAASPPAGGLVQVRGPLTLGIADDVYFQSPSIRATWIDRTVASGARDVVLFVDWAGAAPATRPPGFDAANPADPAYDWSSLDTVISALAARGLSVVLTIADAPSWAEGPGMPRGATPGTWRPDPVAFGEFATAIATRYSGSFPDPATPGAMLPRVADWQVWDEPNLAIHLSPQWVRRGHTFAPASPTIFRGLLNAFYKAVKTVHADNVVITGAMAPYGDLEPGGQRMAPAEFVRDLLCLDGQALASAPCPAPAHFDALAADPYEVGPPTTAALNPDDVSAPDLGKLTRIIDVALQRGRALPQRTKQLWVTEFGYDTKPPNPNGVPVATEARWLEEALYVFWGEGVDTVAWYLIVDEPPVPSYGATWQSGLYLLDGTPKPALQAYRFPFVVEPSGGGLLAWGRAPAAGTVRIEERSGGAWTVLASGHVDAGAVFEEHLGAAGHATFRAVQGSASSLTWRT